MNDSQPASADALAPAGITFPAPGAARLVPTKKIKVNGTTGPGLVRYQTVQHQTVMQSLAFDNAHNRVYIAQVMNGSTTNELGHVTITELTWRTNQPTPGYVQTGHMYLHGFGHVVSIGVEPVGPDSYLWTEVDSVPIVDAKGNKSGRGVRICRFKFEAFGPNDTPIPNNSPKLQKFTPVPGSIINTVNIDPVYGRLVHRFELDGKMRYRVHDLAKARQGIWDDYVADIQQPSPTFAAKYGKPDFQGYAVAGSWLYLLYGNAYEHKQNTDNNDATDPVIVSPLNEGNTHLVSVNLLTGDIDTTFHTKAGVTLTFREPEGLSIRVPDPTKPEEFQVAMGFACGTSGARTVSIYYKSELAPPV
ncbi:teichoic acid biosynthesis protein C [Streptomyces sp. NPDC057638]|uniref:phage baseplate protein n=1 Tax=Streptomyces sp. NPDC057638 TaxID=3346190 RepID=UPI0036BE9FA3